MHPRCASLLLCALLAAAVPSGAGKAEPPYPAGADVVVLSKAGEKVGPLEKLRVTGKYTVFDVYADWCGPCKDVDRYLRELLATRKDIAVRRLNVVDEDSPLSLELGDSVHGLPHLEIYTPKGRRIVVEGTDFDALEEALAAR
jgi:thiol-disulfide isomerase/thioredoxin